MKVGQRDASLGGCSSVRMSEPWTESSFFTPSCSLPFLWPKVSIFPGLKEILPTIVACFHSLSVIFFSLPQWISIQGENMTFPLYMLLLF